MADRDLVERLRTSVEEWNVWREENSEDLIDLKEANLMGANLSKAQLGGALLCRANLAYTILKEADLSDAALSNANLACANLEGADLTEADLSGGCLVAADLKSAKLFKANLTRAELQRANLENADLTGVKWDDKDRDFNRYRGIRISTAYGSPMFKRFCQDQDYLSEVKAKCKSAKCKLLFWLWRISCDCGRSLWRWIFWLSGVLFVFGVIFWGLGSDHFYVNPNGISWSWFAALYCSVVTFSTLGFGDITPKTEWAALCVMGEVLLGYVMLGVLLSILANKIARRS